MNKQFIVKRIQFGGFVLAIALFLTACNNHPTHYHEPKVYNPIRPIYHELKAYNPIPPVYVTNEDDNLAGDMLSELPSTNFDEFSPDVVLSDELPQLTDLGRQVAEDFLMQFPSIFLNNRDIIWQNPHQVANTNMYFNFPRQHGQETDDGLFRVWDSDLGQSVYATERLFHIGYQFGDTYTASNGRTSVKQEPILSADIPNIFFREFHFALRDVRRDGFYDNNLNRIESANWMLHDVQYATTFRLWDFDQDGIPEIEIEYWGHWAGVWPTSPNNSLFIFDGYEYRRVAIWEDEQTRAWREERHRDVFEWVFVNNLWANMILDHLAFLDCSGSLIFMPRVFDEESVGYYYVIFEGNTVKFQRFITISIEDAPYRWYHESHYISGTNILLTPLKHLYREQIEMNEVIRQRLLVE